MNFRAKGLMASLVLGMGLIASLLAGSALAQRPEGDRQPPVRRVEANAGWLILDPAKPVDEILPPLLKALAGLEARGEIIDFDQTPRSSAPTAVPGLRVIARPGALNTLRGLPGVLDVSDRLPPPPPAPGDIGALGATGTITGRVTEAGTGIPLSSVSVNIDDAVSHTRLGWANTDTGGYYTATVTAPFSQVKVMFVAGGWPSLYAPEWYNDKDYFSTADAIILPAGGTIPNVNAALGKLGAINGTVTFDESGLPVEGASVSAHSPDGATNWYWHDTTDGSGHYEFSVPAGIYKLRFAGGPISEEWYQDEVSQPTAYSVTVVTGQTKIINASVAPAGRIVGTVTDEATGLPTTAVITVYDLSDKVVGYTWTDNDGLYQAGGLDTGSYKVRFRKNDYYEEYYDNQPNRAQANLVSVTAGATTSNINAALTPLPSVISGTVTKDGGDRLEWDEDVYVSLYDAASGDWVDDYFFMGDGITTDYTFRVSPGTYHVLFDGVNPGFRIEWYNDKTSQANADLVTVAYGQTKTDVSADLTTATGCITGVLTAADDGSRIPDANVEVFYTEDWWWEDKADSNGEYQICWLAGDFQVRFSHSAYQSQWYNDEPSRAMADVVTVNNGVTVHNVNAVLSLGGCITGHVIDMNGLFRQGAWVDLYDAGRDWGGWFWQESDASFGFHGLPTGNYIVICGDRQLRGSTAVSVTAPQETSGVICQLSPPAYTYLPLILKNGR